ncbi:hypothetical protein ES319_D12G176200v1 [Gossypium barbadense]|uniref:Myb-like domain-containing protein n=1 Tax=Gossypium barbadense TaxID=3634 RepID=A0A5J5NZF9_GOSBA|nr:hypothetical protein ES319_D12G176200v1 [Gossypium barbadense]KAB1999655.1 hypothetical protein ES319_D12G176200v1 [Gossypium barbadense]KAB1999657.1 hypothetical protein ES319_D12G176200v1 [Gossypium barbadense]KAB1999661.1 hypothetical protein ES319_D12G176200v1 [Gossypium barbadense]
MMNQHDISFQSAAIDSSSEMFPMGGYFAPPPMNFSGNSSIFTTSPALIEPGNSSGSSLIDSVAGFTHDTGLAVEWSVDEQYVLKEGLEKYKKEPNIMKYIKIAATLPDKTVRDVALRSRWMQDKLVESSSKMNMPSDLPQNTAPYPLTMHPLDQNGRIPSEGIFGTTMHLLKQNSQVLSQITSNLSAYKLQDNVDLFCHAKNNITAMLKDMRDMPGLMSHMLPLPVSVSEDLANSMFCSATQATILGINLKQEPRC